MKALATACRALKRTRTDACRAGRIIREVEDRYMFDTGIRWIVSLPGGGWHLGKSYWLIGNTIKVPSAVSGRQLRAYTCHEMGHAIYDHYDLRGYLAPFTRKYQRGRREYARASARAAVYPRRAGFASGYARCNRQEDFCETLAAYLLNRNSWRRRLQYEGEAIDVRREPVLLRKLQSLHRLLNDLQHFTDRSGASSVMQAANRRRRA